MRLFRPPAAPPVPAAPGDAVAEAGGPARPAGCPRRAARRRRHRPRRRGARPGRTQRRREIDPVGRARRGPPGRRRCRPRPRPPRRRSGPRPNSRCAGPCCPSRRPSPSPSRWRRSVADGPGAARGDARGGRPRRGRGDGGDRGHRIRRAAVPGAQRRRAGPVALARVLAQRAPLLLLDEPTAALDLKHQEAVLRAVPGAGAGGGRGGGRAARSGARGGGTRTGSWCSGDGRVAADCPPERVFTEELLSEVYEHPVEVFPHPRTGAVVAGPNGRFDVPLPSPWRPL